MINRIKKQGICDVHVQSPGVWPPCSPASGQEERAKESCWTESRVSLENWSQEQSLMLGPGFILQHLQLWGQWPSLLF